ncbi:MAG: hypothetical protein RDU89_02340 [bacterium]|nr:hypothetical protein [bacterium]
MSRPAPGEEPRGRLRSFWWIFWLSTLLLGAATLAAAAITLL